MKQLKYLITLLFLGFIVFVIEKDEMVPCHYYTSYETYYVSSNVNEIVVPVFTSTRDVIFSSDRPHYYLRTMDVTYNIKRNYCRYVKDFTFLNTRLSLYLVSFELGTFDWQIIENAYLRVEYNSVEFDSLIGNIIFSDKNILMLEGEYFSEGVKCQGNINVTKNEFVDYYIYDPSSLKTIIYLKNRNINNYIILKDLDNIYIWQNYNVDLKTLAIYEEEYVEDN